MIILGTYVFCNGVLVVNMGGLNIGLQHICHENSKAKLPVTIIALGCVHFLTLGNGASYHL